MTVRHTRNKHPASNAMIVRNNHPANANQYEGTRKRNIRCYHYTKSNNINTQTDTEMLHHILHKVFYTDIEFNDFLAKFSPLHVATNSPTGVKP